MGGLLCKDCSSAAAAQEAEENVSKPNLQLNSLSSSSVDDRSAQFLSQVKLFKRLPEGQLPILASACDVVPYSSGELVIKEGAEGDAFFIIKSGEATVAIGEKQLATLKEGDYFGENALLREEPRNASITAISDLTLLRITRKKFEDLGLREKLDFPQRKAVGGGAATEMVVKPPSPKTPEERRLMAGALRKNDNLQNCVALDDKKANQLIEIAWKETVPAGTQLIQENDLNANFFYIVQSGSFQLSMATGGSQSADAAEAAAQQIGTVDSGGSFGELALLYFAPRAATVTAAENSVVWVIDRTNFKAILAKSAGDLAKEYTKYLDNVSLLNPLKADEKQAVAEALYDLSLSQDETIFQQGEAGKEFYILVEGEVSVVADGKEQTKLKASKSKASFFGEQALINNAPRTATIKVISEMAKALVLDRSSFDMLLGPLEELKNRKKDAPSKLAEKKKEAERRATARGEDKRFGKIERKNLKQLGLLGCGGFGAVELVEHMDTGDTYALKALSKGYVVKSGMQQSVMSEKNVQMMCDSEFVVRLYETYNGTQTLYFLLELALGGELYATYNKKGFFGKDTHAKFYTSGVVFAFDHLHDKKIIFRDLKPENLLLNEKGQIKLTDMGLAKVVVGKTYTTCGTPDYFAPELIASAGHGMAVDWWTLGILLFELLSGHPPFESTHPMQIYQKVQKGILKVTFPAKCKGPAENLIKSLCQKDPADRLAMKKGGSSQIKQHQFYKGFDWDAMEKQSMTPPYVPMVKSKKDAANFSARKEDMPPHVAYKDDGTGWDKEFATSV
mmetsp:Transcript_85511/g.151313  ORF Transcript_85511/g.151313 Transcript_85511/m.151313 type:complete len:793 (+) Transcript_85511:80-2458(+)|eukprot:CAMPEP_0197635094 /NCGR_PEP_ID=MMETSP1338-20131121/11004_1 /TAXON_ID=43686 ORGANISM="Pelagodinium beii, Strain RCC1491" /NCGR_SAMPLE_ID=MMETSP1338 /ASSEMBLY_ACC=CAM_ASM_000754 /LENGTH=792 /DNA_ID=CAMNT_0043207077 /DNA_START=53 /DNA_END=2431 /DNA_ORIENTATION=-